MKKIVIWGGGGEAAFRSVHDPLEIGSQSTHSLRSIALMASPQSGDAIKELKGGK